MRKVIEDNLVSTKPRKEQLNFSVKYYQAASIIAMAV